MLTQQVPPDLTSASLQQFGAWAISLLLALAAIGWLLKRLGKSEDTIEARDVSHDALYDRIIAQGEHFSPVLQEATGVIEANTQMLARVHAQLEANQRAMERLAERRS